jgi:hypothetical protein
MHKSQNIYWRTLENHARLIFFAIIVSAFIGMVLIIGLDHSFWGDEAHFVVTIRYFGENFTLSTLTDYDQVSGPLVFMLYALWGKVTTFEIFHLRQLSLFLSAVTFMLIFHLYVKTLFSQKAALLAASLLLLNPYMWGLSFFVFTDIVSLCFLVLIAWAVNRQQPILLFIATALALLSRQYSVYLIVAAGFYQLVILLRGDKFQILNIIALILGCFPLLVLMFIWGGIAPPSGMNRWVVTDNQVFHYNYITTYITFIALYLLPIIAMMWRQLFKQYFILLVCFFISGWYLLFPVRPSHVTLIQTQFNTVGLLHRMIKNIVEASIFENVLLWLLFLCGLVLLANIVCLDVRRFRHGEWDYGHFLTLAAISFLIIMPFSYQLWEKYLVAVLPFIMLRLMLMKAAYMEQGNSSYLDDSKENI